jgi:hypothetical protein
VRDPKDVGRCARIIDVLYRAAPPMQARRKRIFLRPETHCQAKDFVTISREETRSDGGIDAAAHGDNNTGP